METKQVEEKWFMSKLGKSASGRLAREIYTSKEVIAEVYGKSDENAQLIKASKDLLEALINLKASHAHLYSKLTAKAKSELIDYMEFPAIKLSIAAINKAKS